MKKYLKKLSVLLLSFSMAIPLQGYKGSISYAAEQENYPKIGVVSLEHFPFIEQEDNSIYFCCDNYSDKVQYQTYLTIDEKNNELKPVVNNDMLNGWTKAKNGKDFSKIDLKNLDLKEGTYKFVVRVKAFDKVGKNKDKYGEYDDSYVFTTKIAKPYQDVYEVSNSKELLEKIGPNRIIKLKAGEYDLSKDKLIDNEYVKFSEVFDGFEVIVSNVNNLIIEGENSSNTKLLANPRYANVLTFENCKNVNIKGITAGHYPDKGECTGGVLVFEKCKKVNVDNSVLFGCGTYGVNLHETNDFLFSNSTIKECSYGIMTIDSSNNIKFVDSKFYDTKQFSLINITNGKNVTFEKCTINNNIAEKDYLFYVFSSSNVVVKNCCISNNKVKYYANDEKSIIFEKNEDKDNKFNKMFEK